MALLNGGSSKGKPKDELASNVSTDHEELTRAIQSLKEGSIFFATPILHHNRVIAKRIIMSPPYSKEDRCKTDVTDVLV